MKPNPLICLCVIVGNEESVIERFVRSFAQVADKIVFIKAIGNQEEDDTQKIIEATCLELGVNAEFGTYQNAFSEWEHVDDFAAARTMAWKRGEKSGAKYLMWADADDIISAESAKLIRDAAESESHDVFIVPYEVRGKSQIIYRERLARNDGSSFWRYPVHELLNFNRNVEYRCLKNAAIIHAPLSKKKSSEIRNRIILEDAIKDGARHLFFLSQEAFSRGQFERFKVFAKAAITHPGLDTTEHYEILLNLAQQESDCIQAKSYAARAFEMMPDRREALALLSCYGLVDGRNEEAYALAKIMASIPIPLKAYWTLNRDWYTWKGFYLLMQTMRACGFEDKAVKMEDDQFQKHGALFSICHGTYLRPEQALAIRDLYLGRARNPMAVEYIFGIHHDDEASLKMLKGYRHTITDKEGCSPNAIEAMKASSGKFIMIVADDLIPPDGWDEKLAECLAKNNASGFGGENKQIVINFDDSLRRDGHMSHAFMTREYMEGILKDPWPGTGIFSDDEFTFRARRAGVVIDAPEIVFDHRHYSTGAVPMDATYMDQNKEKNYREGYKILIDRNPEHIRIPKLEDK